MHLNDHLDPGDWEEFSRYLGEFATEEILELAESIKGDVWQPVPDELKQQFQREHCPQQGSDLDQVIQDYRQRIRPYRAGNTHPRFFGWVQGTGTMPALMADIAISAMNSNCGGRDHGAVYIERQVMNWCKELFDFPQSAGGLLTSGTSASTQYAMQIAMFKKLGIEHKQKGFFAESAPLRCYASSEGHSSIIKAVQTCGIGSDNLVVIQTDDDNRIHLDELERQIRDDLDKGFKPFMVLVNAGTVNTGAFDDFRAIRELCDRHQCWMHVDGAFGAWMKIADQPYRDLADGLELADSIAFDFHKLIYVQYDCGALLVADEKFQRQVFSIRPNYLSKHGQALAGGEPWFCDYGLELSRSFRALKVWFTFKAYGAALLGSAVTRNCQLARLLAEEVEASDYLEIDSDPVSNIVTFKLNIENDPERHNRICEQVVADMQLAGEVVFSLTRCLDYRVIRASITNHRTREQDIVYSIDRLNQRIEQLISKT
jgi:glutamate/tyrosine decarboxylase-like PLP-dependent enzyme